MRAALFWRDKKLHPVCEKNQPDFIVIADRAESEQARDFRGQFAFRLGGASEISRRANIDNQHHGQLAFFGKFFDERVSETGSHVPIDRANVVARLILAHVFKIHSATFEDAVIIPCEDSLDQTLRFNFQRADFFKNLRGSLLQTVHRRSGNGKAAKNALDDRFARDRFGFGFVTNDDAMP